jgi:glucose/mannose transport system substrate-binding protein
MSRKLRFLLVLALACATLFAVRPASISQAQGADQIEVFSYWTSGGEAAALQALFDTYKTAQPKTEIINSLVAGGAGTNAFAVLQTRLQGHNPPDTWQTHLGLELQDYYVDPGYVVPINDLYKSEGWDKVLPKTLMDLLTHKDGNIYAVLTGVHRGNDLWYNKKLLDKNGITVGDKLTWDEFIKDADKLKAAGVPAVCLGDTAAFASAIIFEQTLIANLGPAKYADLYAGKVAWDDPLVIKSMDDFGTFLSYAQPDHAALTWDQAIKALQDGKCAFSEMGDWADGEFVKAKLAENVDFGWVNFPGTDGYFDVVGDAFVLAKDAPHKDNAIAWLKSVGSKAAQEAFNPLKGSIAIRTDATREKQDKYHLWSMDSFAKDTLVGGINIVAHPAFITAVYDGATQFVVDHDSKAYSAALVKAFAETAPK